VTNRRSLPSSVISSRRCCGICRSFAARAASVGMSKAEIILLRVVAGLDAPAVARIVGKSPGAVRVAAHRGLRRLAGVLDQAGVTV
jgi:DNA-directed RNA polymerase specialized sigma24 family protein